MSQGIDAVAVLPLMAEMDGGSPCVPVESRLGQLPAGIVTVSDSVAAKHGSAQVAVAPGELDVPGREMVDGDARERGRPLFDPVGTVRRSRPLRLERTTVKAPVI